MRRTFLVVLLINLSACAGFSTAPPRYSRTADRVLEDVYGSWVDVSIEATSMNSRKVAGELIAVSEDSLYVLTDRDSARFMAIPKNRIDHVLLTRQEVGSLHYVWIAGGGMMIALATVVQASPLIIPGYMLVGIVGIISGEASRYKSYQRDSSEDSWLSLGAYSRFPQGLIFELSRDSLTLK
jgi:hypothetical protein